MASRKMLNSVLHNFLATFASRNSDHAGYWLFGQLSDDLDWWSVDLRSDPPQGALPVEVARRLAVRRFREQVCNAGLDMSVVAEALLTWSRVEPMVGWLGGHEVSGHRVVLLVRVETYAGRVLEQSLVCFVAPHDPCRERRRLPADWGA